MDRVLDSASAEDLAILRDIRVAEEQIARGEGMEHDAAREQVLSRLRNRTNDMSS